MPERVLTDLCKLAIKHRTDKVPTISHGYTPYYSELFAGRNVKKLLEIGIGYPGTMGHVEDYVTGASLFMWQEYFPEAEIYGLDINPETLINEGRIKSFLCDQSSASSLQEVTAKLGGGFDVIIDDGSHITEHQVLSAKILFPLLLNPDGLYIIEDVWHPEEVVSRLPYKCEIKNCWDMNPAPREGDTLVIIRGNGLKEFQWTTQ